MLYGCPHTSIMLPGAAKIKIRELFANANDDIFYV